MRQHAFLAANAASAAQQLGLAEPEDTPVKQQQQQKQKKKGQKQLQNNSNSSSNALAEALAERLQGFGLLGPQQAKVAAALTARRQLLCKEMAGDAAAAAKLKQELPLSARCVHADNFKFKIISLTRLISPCQHVCS